MIFNAINLASQIAYNPLGQGIGYALYLILEKSRLNNQVRSEKIRFDVVSGVSKVVFARLGEIEFLMVDGLTSFRESVKHRIAVHESVLGKEVVQMMGAGLREISLSMTFHQFFGDPRERIELVREACEDGKVRRLAFGNGVYDGEYVIESLDSTVVQCAPDGTPIHATADVRLKEYVEKEVATIRRAPKPKPRSAPKPKQITASIPKGLFVPVVNGRAYPNEVVEVQ